MNNNAASLRELVATRVPMYTGCGFIWSESDELSFVVNGGRLYAHRDEIMKCLNGKHVDVIFNTKVSELIACVEFCKGI